MEQKIPGDGSIGHENFMVFKRITSLDLRIDWYGNTGTRKLREETRLAFYIRLGNSDGISSAAHDKSFFPCFVTVQAETPRQST